MSYGKKLEFLHDRSAFSHDSLPMLDFCVHMVEELERLKSPVLEMPENRRKLPLTPRYLQELAGLCVGKTILIQMGRPREFKVVREDPRLEVYISKSDGGVLVQTEFFLLEEGTEGLIVQVGDTLYLCGEEYSADCGAFLRQCAKAEEQELFIAEKDFRAVLGGIGSADSAKLLRCAHAGGTPDGVYTGGSACPNLYRTGYKRYASVPFGDRVRR